MLDFIIQLFQDIFFFTAYVNGGNSFPEPLPPAQEQELIALCVAGDQEARAKLIEHNLRLVAHIAKKYANGRDMDDIISIGTIGLIKAVSTFNTTKGTALATYAARCIENEILMSIRAEKRLTNEVSLQESIGTDKDGNDISLADLLGSSETLVSDEAELNIASQHLMRIMKKVLTERERVVIQLRYGILGGPCLAQREIANMLDISRSYVSRIEKKALMKLNHAFAEENLLNSI